MSQRVTNPNSIYKDVGLIPALAQWVKDLALVAHGSNMALLWLWCSVEAAAPIQPLAWELPYATSVALKKKKEKERKKWPHTLIGYCVGSYRLLSPYISIIRINFIN